MDKQKKQHKPIVCRKHTIIERERLLAHEDIINDTQYSGKEEGTQIVTYWKDEETGETLVSDAYSKGKLKGSGWYFPTALKQPEVPIYDWTPNYTGQGYVEIPEFVVGSGSWEIEADLKFNKEGTHYVFSSGTEGMNNNLHIGIVRSRWFIGYWANDLISDSTIDIGKEYHVKFYFDGDTRGIIVDGVLVASDKQTVFVNSSGSAYIGSLNIKNPTDGTIKNMRLTTEDGSDNRFYESVIKSKTEPETLVLEGSISGKQGTLKNFPENAVWKDITPIEIDGEQ